MPTQPEEETAEEKGLRKLFEQVAGSVRWQTCDKDVPFFFYLSRNDVNQLLNVKFSNILGLVNLLLKLYASVVCNPSQSKKTFLVRF